MLSGSVNDSAYRLAGSRNEVWRATAFSGARGVMLYVKLSLTLHRMVAELVAAQVGRAMGLPCPQAYLVSVAPHHIGHKRGPSMLCFGVEQVGPNSTAVPVRCMEPTRRSANTVAAVVHPRRRALPQPLLEVRHTFASAALTAGQNPFYMADQLGHADVRMVFKVYGKFISPDFQRPRAQPLRLVGSEG